MHFTRRIRKHYYSSRRHFREAGMIAHALKSPYHPILVHLIPIRRCNLSCTYCNEYDDFSKPVPTDQLLHRIDLLAALGSANIHLSGGEPLLHPDIVHIIRHICSHKIFAGLLTNGYLLTRDLIQELNAAGLDYLQISVDNVRPDDVSKKSLKVLDKKLQWLAELAEFEVNINSVVGASKENVEDAVIVAQRAAKLGLKSTVGIIHDGHGQLVEFDEQQKRIYQQAISVSQKSFVDGSYYNQFQKNLMQGRPNQWHCRAGSRYLYVCEEGLVHYCSQQRGHPGIPLEQYTHENLERENVSVKPCAPYCTISCVHRVALIDDLRERPLEAIERFFPAEAGIQMPALVRCLKWIFLSPNPGRQQRLLKRAVQEIFRITS